MSTDQQAFSELLQADAARRATAPRRPVAADAVEQPGSAEHRFRLVNTLPRESREVFGALRETLAPFGYTLSPLHPGMDLHRPRMQTELALHDGPQFAPLVFELERGGSKVRVFVRQFGGRAVPDFTERTIDLAAPLDRAGLRDLLQDYVTCMLRPLNRPAAA